MDGSNLLLILKWRLSQMATQMCQLKWKHALQGEQFTQLTAMVNVVGHDPPECPLLRDREVFSLIGMKVGLT